MGGATKMILSRPSITQTERDYVEVAMSQSDIGIGEFIPRFEESWASYNNTKYGVSCNSGTNALFLALKALGIGKGDEVLVPEYTMAATAWAVSYTGATPVFIDCKDDLNIDENLIEEAISPKTKAIIPVHIYGRQCNMEVIFDIVSKYGLKIVEDMAEAHGIQPKSDIACYSFYGNKILTTGEGGMCLTDDYALANEMRLLANMYVDKDRTMIHPQIGYNFRMTNLQAAVGLAQVERVDEILEKRKQIEAWYDEYIPPSMKMPKRDVLWMYDIDCGDRQAELKKILPESRYGFKPMSMQPMYRLPYQHLNAYKWSKRILYLPTYTDLTEADIQETCQLLK